MKARTTLISQCLMTKIVLRDFYEKQQHFWDFSVDPKCEAVRQLLKQILGVRSQGVK